MKQTNNPIPAEQNSQFITPHEVSQLLQISVSHSYKLVREMNEQLKAQGYMTISGRISRKYFQEKFYGFEEVNNYASL
ncbi:MAG: DNA-binding protein [Eubacteriales bacterium]